MLLKGATIRRMVKTKGNSTDTLVLLHLWNLHADSRNVLWNLGGADRGF